MPNEGMFCAICKKYGKPPPSARGAWVSKPISNWVKETELMRQVFSDPKQLGQLEVQITESDRKSFIQGVYNPYIQSVIDHITSRIQSSDVFSAFSIFNPFVYQMKNRIYLCMGQNS